MRVEDSRLLDKRYRLLEYLGGSNTEVYRGYDRQLCRPVAVKIARPGPEFEPARFENEMRVLAGLRHPSLVTLYDAGLAERRPYLVMQYVPGATLARRLRCVVLAPDEVRRIGHALAAALEYLHAENVVHRDVKPENVLLSEDGEIYLADLGIARTSDTAALTADGTVIGTPAYLAPEQVNADPVGPPCDIYALGLVLLECLTGEREYRGNPVEAALMRLSRPPRIPRGLPAPWSALLASMTALAPADRPTAAEVADRLAPTRSVRLPGPAARTPRRRGPALPGVRPPAPSSRAARRQAAAALAAGATALVALTGITAWPGATQRPVVIGAPGAVRTGPATPPPTTPPGTPPPSTPPAGTSRSAPPAATAPHSGQPAPGADEASRDQDKQDKGQRKGKHDRTASAR